MSLGLSCPSVKDARVTVPSDANSSQIITPSSAVSGNPIWFLTRRILENVPVGFAQLTKVRVKSRTMIDIGSTEYASFGAFPYLAAPYKKLPYFATVYPSSQRVGKN